MNKKEVAAEVVKLVNGLDANEEEKAKGVRYAWHCLKTGRDPKVEQKTISGAVSEADE